MSRDDPKPGERRALPPPESRGSFPLERSIAARRSVREFEEEPLTERQLSQLLWAMQGITGHNGLRAAPSAGALYPLEVWVASTIGLEHYEPEHHALTLARAGDPRQAICRAALDQSAILQAPVVFVIAEVLSRTERVYGKRSRRYVDMEIGHAAQNLLLQAVALGLGGAPIVAFDDGLLRRALMLPGPEAPRYLIPVGRPR